MVTYEVTTLLKDPTAFRRSVDLLTVLCGDRSLDRVAAVESRGFILGAAVANALGCGFVPIRKPGKLPAKTVRETYSLEYGATASRCTTTRWGRARGC